MAKPPDLEHLANRYLDLWQEQAAALAADPALAEAMSRLFGLASTAAAPFGKGDGSHDAREQHAAGSGASGGSTTARAAAAPAASDAGGGDVGELARRLAAVEERLAALEARVAGAGDGARGKPRKRSR